MRRVKTISYVLSLIAAIQEVWLDFLQFRHDILYDIQINGQTIHLERVLNDKFDIAERRIYITDGEYFEPPVFYEEYKNLPVIFFDESNTNNPAFYTQSNLDNRVSFNFFVHIPADVWHDRVVVRALVQKYKIFGRTFDIVII
jgi:hypothetical protein